jgi:hypothetical protein
VLLYLLHSKQMSEMGEKSTGKMLEAEAEEGLEAEAASLQLVAEPKL